MAVLCVSRILQHIGQESLRLAVWVGWSEDLMKASHGSNVIYEDQVICDNQ